MQVAGLTPISSFNSLPSTTTRNYWRPDYWEPTVERYYTNYIHSWTNQPNKIEQAFKIIQKLIELNLMKVETVNDFINAVTKISEVL